MNTDETRIKRKPKSFIVFVLSVFIRVPPRLTRFPGHFHDDCGASQDSGGVAGYYGIRWDAAGDYAAGSHHGVFADGEVGQDGGAGADGGSTLDQGGGDLPIVFGLQGAVRRGSRVEVVDEGDAVADEDVVFNGDAFADEGVAGDFAIAADSGVFLDFDKGADLGVVADLAAVEVDELREFYVLAEFDVGGDAEVVGHGRRGNGRG